MASPVESKSVIASANVLPFFFEYRVLSCQNQCFHVRSNLLYIYFVKDQSISCKKILITLSRLI